MIPERNEGNNLASAMIRPPCRQLLVPQDLALTARSLIGNSDREHMVLLCLDIKNHIVAVHTVAIGNAFMTCFSAREVMRVALLCNASSVALAHNHPSGDPEPSPDDIEHTRRLVRAGRLMGINVIDHMVLGEGNRYVSMAEKFAGILQQGRCSQEGTPRL